MTVASFLGKSMNNIRPFCFTNFLCPILIGVLFHSQVAGGTAPEGRDGRDTLIPNPDFREGADLPAGWRLSAGPGRWLASDILEIEGRGQDPPTGGQMLPSNRGECTCSEWSPGILTPGVAALSPGLRRSTMTTI